MRRLHNDGEYVGGLGSAVAEVMAGAGRRLVRLGIPDRYAHGASRRYLIRETGIDAAALVAAVEEPSSEAPSRSTRTISPRSSRGPASLVWVAAAAQDGSRGI